MRCARKRKAMCAVRILCGKENLRKCFPMRKQRISLPLLRTQKRYGKYQDHGPSCVRRRRLRKTEVALRAAFKAVQESRQVIYLVPTTILAQQVYNTFVQRMKEFPVRVDLLCRFRTAAQQQKTISDLKKARLILLWELTECFQRMWSLRIWDF